MATYSTDLTTLTTAGSGTWVELTGTILGFSLSGGGSPGNDTENKIQGTSCYSQTTGKAQDAEISIAFDFGSNRTFTAGHVVFGWMYYAVGANLKTKANSGWMWVIASSLTAGDYFVIGGSDSGRNPYGGWTNVAIDPTATESGTFGGGGNGGNYRYFGHVCNTIGEITKGNPSAVDAIRAGRGIISITGSGGSFAELASYNDYNAGGTPPGTSSTSKDSGRHRFGLFQATGKSFLWKGLLSFGTTGASVTFVGSNVAINIDDCPFTYASFNKIEVNNASSSVTLTNVSIFSGATTANGIGYFEMIANATVIKSGCLFVDMGTFIYLSNGNISGTTFVRCELITLGGCTFSGNKILNSPAAISLTTTSLNLVDDCEFTSDGSNHAVELTALGSGTQTWNSKLTSYVAGTVASPVTPGSTGNEAIYVNFTSSSNLTINVAAGATVPSIRVAAGFTGNVNVVAGQVTIKFTITDEDTGALLQYARIEIQKNSDKSNLFQLETNTSGVATTTMTYTVDIPVVGWVRQWDISGDDYTPKSFSGTIGTNGLDLSIALKKGTTHEV